MNPTITLDDINKALDADMSSEMGETSSQEESAQTTVDDTAETPVQTEDAPPATPPATETPPPATPSLDDHEIVLKARRRAADERAKLLQEQQVFEQKRALFEAQKSELDRYRETVDFLRKDPLTGLKLAGVNPQDFMLTIAKDGKPDPQRDMLTEMKARLDNLEKENNDLKSYRQQTEEREAAAKAEAEAIKARDGFFEVAKALPNVRKFIKANPRDVYINASNYTRQTYEETGVTPPWEETAKVLDAYYEKQLQALKEEEDAAAAAVPAQGPSLASGNKKKLGTPGPSIAKNEKRSNEKSFSELSEDEQDELLEKEISELWRKG